MGKNKYRITKQSWFKVDGQEVILFKSTHSTSNNKTYYYIQGGKKIYVSESEIRKQFYGRKNKLTGKIKVTKIYKNVKVKGINKDGLLGSHNNINTEITVIERFDKKNLKGNQYYNSVYKDNIEISNEIKSICKKIKHKKEVYEVFEMKENILELMKARMEYTNEVNKEFNKVSKIIQDKYEESCYKAVLLEDKDLSGLYNVLKEFNLEKKNLNETSKKHLIDSNSSYTPQTCKIDERLRKIIESVVRRDISIDDFCKQMNLYYAGLIRSINVALDFPSSNPNKANIEYLISKKNQGIDVIDNYINPEIKKYNLKKLTENINKHLENNKGKNVVVSTLPSIIRDNYNTTYSDDCFNDKTNETIQIRMYVVKEIHNYVLGRARKVKKMVDCGEIKKNQEVLDKDIFNLEKIENKIRRSFYNKMNLKEIEDNKMKIFDLENYNIELAKQQLHLFETFNKKLNNLTFEAISVGIAEFKSNEYDEIFSARDFNDFKSKLDICMCSDSDKKEYLKAAYFLRNFTLHQQKIGEKEDANTIEKFINDFINRVKTDHTDEKEKLVEYELEKIKFNNCFKYVKSEKFNILCQINLFQNKSQYLPRFRKVFNGLYLKIDDPSKEQALKYFLKLLYSHGFEEWFCQIGNNIVDNLIGELTSKENSEIEALKKNDNGSKKKLEDELKKKEANIEKLKIEFKSLIDLGFSEYRISKTVGVNSELDKNKFNRQYLFLISRLFQKYLKDKKLSSDNLDLILYNEPRVDEVSDDDIRNTIKENANALELGFKVTPGLMTIAIYGTAMLGGIETMSGFKQAIDRYLTLYKSLNAKYNVAEYEENYSRILNKYIIEKNFNDALSEISRFLDVKIMLYNYENIKCIDTNKPIEEIIKKALGNQTDWKYIKYNSNGEKVEVSLWEQEAKFGENKIIPRTFIINEYKQGTLNYMIDAHLYAMKKINFDYKEVLSSFERYHKNFNLDDISSSLGLKVDSINDHIEDSMCNYIVQLNKIRKSCFEKLKESKEENKVEIDTIDVLKKVIPEINDYHFYSNVLTLAQLRKNKAFLRKFTVAPFNWLYQMEVFAGNAIGSGYGNNAKDDKIEKVGDIVKEFDVEANDYSINDIRNNIAHMNIYHHERQYSSKSYNDIYNELTFLNSYETKKRNEVSEVLKKNLYDFNIELKDNVFISREKEYKFGAQNFVIHNISSKEAEYYEYLFNYCILKQEEANE